MSADKLTAGNNELFELTVLFFLIILSAQVFMFCEVQNVVLLTEMALMSLVCPVKVCLQAPSLRSHSLARESQAPEMKVFMSGDSASDIQSPMWLVKIIFCLPVSRSHRQLVNRAEERVMSELILALLWKKITYTGFSWGNSPSSVTRSCQNFSITNETAAR